MSKMAQKSNGVGEMFQLFRDGSPRTRAELAQITGTSRSTIAARMDSLIKLGLIGPSGEATSTGGRPPATFVMNPKAAIVLAVYLGATHANIALTDLNSTVIGEHTEILEIVEGPEPVLTRVADVAKKLLRKHKFTLADLKGIGIGLPGPVEHQTGIPVNPPIMPGWDGADVPAILFDLLGTSAVVDNEVNMMAYGEHSANYPEIGDVLFVKVATGIGAGVISDGALRRGDRGAAGDLGHVAVPGKESVLCGCGNYGCLEAIASGSALAAALSDRGIAAKSSHDVVQQVRSGDPVATELVREAGRDIGRVLATCVSLLNPNLIIIGGSIAQAGEHLLAGIRELVYQRSLPLATQKLRITSTSLGNKTGILGASAMAADHILSPAAINDLAENAL